MNTLDALHGMLDSELEEIVKAEGVTSGNLECISVIVRTIKDIHKIKMMESDDYSGKVSRRGYPEDDGRESLRERLEEMIHTEDLTEEEKIALRKAIDAVETAKH